MRASFNGISEYRDSEGAALPRDFKDLKDPRDLSGGA